MTLPTSAERIALHPLTFIDEGDDVMVGRPDIDSYAVFPADGAALLRELADGVAPEEAARRYQERYGEPVDMVDFLETVAELGFLRDDDDGESGPASAETVRWQRLGRAVFSVPAWVAYAALVAVATVLAVREPALRPSYRSLFFVRYYTVITLVLFLGQIPGLLLHEGFHALAGRRLGLPSRLGVSRRLYYVVAETTLNGLLSVPRRKRYLPFLAGMVADLVLAAALVVTAAALRGPAPLAGGICMALALATLLRFGWQCCVHLQTDLYYVISTALGGTALQAASRDRLAGGLRRLLRRPTPVEHPQWTDRDLALARWYAPALVLGYTYSLGLLAFVGLPAAWRVAHGLAHRLTAGGSTGEMLDAVVFLALNGLQGVVLCIVFIRDRRRRATRPKAVLAD